MPTWEEYEAGGQDLRNVLGRINEQTPNVDSGVWDDVATQGYVRDVVEQALNASRENCKTLTDALVSLANECSWRESVCYDYDRQLEAYLVERELRRKLPGGSDSAPPDVPPLPYPWVTPTVEV